MTGPMIRHGKPCVRGLCYPVEFVLELMSSGMTTEQNLADYPDLVREDLLVVVRRGHSAAGAGVGFCGSGRE